MVLHRHIRDILMFILTRQPLDQLSIPSRPARCVATQIRCRREQPRQNRTIYNADAIPASPKLQEGGSNEILSVVSRLSDATRMPKHPIAMQIEQSAKGRTITLQAASPKTRLALSRRSDRVAGSSRLHTYKCPDGAQTVQNIPGRRCGAPRPGRGVVDRRLFEPDGLGERRLLGARWRDLKLGRELAEPPD
jgi:hypothetical protein